MRYAIHVAGLFHYKSYIRFLAKRQDFTHFFYSHRRSTTFEELPGKYTNIPTKEYLTGLHLKLFKNTFLQKMLPLYHKIWDRQLVSLMQPMETNLFLLHGANPNAIRRCKTEGLRVVGEAVNIHPLNLEKMLEFEFNSLGVKYSSSQEIIDKQLEEISMCDQILCPSQAVRDSYVENGYPRSQLVVIPYGSKPAKNNSNAGNKYPRADSSSGVHDHKRNFRVLFVGQIDIRKGVHYLVKAIEMLRLDSAFSETELTLVGRQNPPYLAMLKSFGVQFIHIPHIPHAEMQDLMAAHDILVLPSIEDGFGMVVPEAIEAGTRVLVSKYAGASECLIPYPDLIFDPNDTQYLCDQIKKQLKLTFRVNSNVFFSWSDYANMIDRFLSLPYSTEGDLYGELPRIVFEK